MKDPKVSICIPSYKQTNYLKKTLDSILIQNYTDYELIITDDTPDNTVKQLIDTYDFKGKLKYYKNPMALGSPQNWNECISKATGEYIKIMHHDDWFTQKDSLQKFILKADQNDPVFIFSEAISYNERENIEKIHTPGEVFLKQLSVNPEFIFLGNLIGPPSSILFRKSDLITFDINLKWLTDIDFYIKILQKTKSFYFIKEPLITSVNNGLHNLTNDCINPEVEIFEYFYVFKKLSVKNRNDKQYKQVLINLLIKYNINSIEKLKKYINTLQIDEEITKIINKAKVSIKLNKIKSYFNVN